MNEKVYIRFTDDIDADIERGYSTFKGGEKLAGLCAWTTPYFYNNGCFKDYNGSNVSKSDIKEYAQSILDNTYGSYGSNDCASIITGMYVGSGNDGVLLQDVNEIDSIYF